MDSRAGKGAGRKGKYGDVWRGKTCALHPADSHDGTEPAGPVGQNLESGRF
jgi:hypothetical protein